MKLLLVIYIFGWHLFAQTWKSACIVTGFKNEDELLNAYKAVGLQIANRNSSRNVRDATVPVLAGVVFTNPFDGVGTTFPLNIKVVPNTYKCLFNA